MERLPAFLILIGLLCLVTTVGIGWVFIPNLIHQKIENTVRLDQGSETWSRWANISTPIFIKFYIFNVTNPTEIQSGKKPELDELGPYVYEQKRQKFDISVNEAKDTIKYKQSVSYFFRQDLSHGSDKDAIYALNIPLVGISKRLAKMPGIVSLFANMYVSRFDQKLFFDTTVERFLFKGLYHALVDELQNTFELKILPNSTFGLYFGKNNTDDGLYEIQSGRRNVQEFGKVVKWNSQSNLNWWAGKYCNMINGSDGSIFAPFVERSRVLEIFTPDLCRSLYLTYVKDVDFFGVPAYKFTVPKMMLEDPRVNHDNMCFCHNPGYKLEGCPRAGALKLSACRKGAPIVVSTPHFLDGYDGYVSQSIGLHPVRPDHETFIELEPNTGAVLRVNKRIQINVELEPISTLDIFRKVPSMLFPIIWMDEGASMSPDSIELLKSKLVTPIQIVSIGRCALVGFSTFMVVAGILVHFVRARNKKTTATSLVFRFRKKRTTT